MHAPARLRLLVPPIGGRAGRLLAGAALAQVGYGLFLPFLYLYANEVRGFDPTTSALVVAAVNVGGIAAVTTGGIVDRFGAARITAAGLVVAALGCLGIAASHEPASAIGAAVVHGLGLGGMWNSLFALLAQAVPPAHRSDAFGVNYATQNLGLGLGATLGGAVLDPAVPATFEWAFVGTAASALAFAALLVATGEVARPRPAARAEGSAQAGYRAVLSDRALVAVVVLNALIVIVAFGQITSAFSAWAALTVASPTTVVGWAWSANTFTIVVAQLFALRLLAGRRRTRAAAAASAGFGVAWLIALAAGLAGGAPAAAGLVVSLAVFGLSETLLSPSVSPMVNDLAPDDLRGRYNALYNLSWQGGLVVGPSIAGIALGLGWGGGYFAALAVACAAVGALAIAIERVVPDRANRRASQAPDDRR